MKHPYRFLFFLWFCGTALHLHAQQESPQALYIQGEQSFQARAFGAAVSPLTRYLQLTPATPLHATARQEAAYMLACSAYELNDPHCIGKLRTFLDTYPDTPHAPRICALIASAYFFRGDYDNALAMFNAAQPELLADDERNDITYRMASCYLQSGQLQEAAVWFETLRVTSPRHAADCTYYLAYIRYTQQRYDEALHGFGSLQTDAKYGKLAPYYMAEIYLLLGADRQAAGMAETYLKNYPEEPHAAQMERVLGVCHYRKQSWQEARTHFKQYLTRTDEPNPRRDALYMLGLSAYECAVYSEAINYLGQVTFSESHDALAQNAYLHMGMAYLQQADVHKARMAFEQAAASTADLKVKEQAAYNHALCIHETSYSAFGESVTVFERFLNEFPHSTYADKVSDYLVEVYMNTRSYEAALQSIRRITHPGRRVLEAKQKILFQLGTQAFANTRFDEADQYLAQSIQLGEYNRQTLAEAHYWYGESRYRQGDMEQAERHFRQYLSLHTGPADVTYALAHYDMGYIAFHRKAYSTAESWFRRFADMAKNNPSTALADTYNRLGDCALHSRRFGEAAQWYTKAEGMETAAGDYACYQLGLVAGLQKEYTQKVAWLDRLVAHYPQSPYAVNALYEKARSYVQQGRNPQAIATFRQLVEKFPDSPICRKAIAEMGLLYYQNEEYDRAIEAYKQVISHYPGSDEARMALRDLKSIYVDANRVDELSTLSAQLPGQPLFAASEQDSLTYMAAEKVSIKGNPEAARTSFERYLQSYPQGMFQMQAHYQLCLLGQAMQDEEAVLTHATALLAYQGNAYAEEALMMRAELYFNRKAYHEALTDYRQLQATASTPERRKLGTMGVLRCSTLTHDDDATIQAATTLLAEAKLEPELQTEACYHRAKAYLHQHAEVQAQEDLQAIATDTRTRYGAEAKYLLAQLLFDRKAYAEAEKEILDFIDQSTPHAYWLARSFVLLSDLYKATGKPLDARQYLLSLQQNYTADDDIQIMINERLAHE